MSEDIKSILKSIIDEALGPIKQDIGVMKQAISRIELKQEVILEQVVNNSESVSSLKK